MKSYNDPAEAIDVSVGGEEVKRIYAVENKDGEKAEIIVAIRTVGNVSEVFWGQVTDYFMELQSAAVDIFNKP